MCARCSQSPPSGDNSSVLQLSPGAASPRNARIKDVVPTLHPGATAMAVSEQGAAPCPEGSIP